MEVRYIRCMAHRENLIVEHACSSSSIVRKMFEILQELYVFFTGGTKRVIAYKRALERAESMLKLRNLSMTRWTSRSESLTALWASFDTIVEVLEELIEQDEDKIIKEKAQALHRHINCFDFIVTLMFMRQVMFRTKVLAEKLQDEQLDLMTANKKLWSARDILDALLQDTAQIEKQIEASKAAAEKFGSIAEDEFRLKHRPRRPPSRYSEVIPNSGADMSDDWKSFYVKELCGILRILVNGLDDAIHDNSSFLEPAYQCLLGKMDDSYESLS